MSFSIPTCVWNMKDTCHHVRQIVPLLDLNDNNKDILIIVDLTLNNLQVCSSNCFSLEFNPEFVF